jgi:predicted Fe-Mo cluster-binding NifX family protein
MKIAVSSSGLSLESEVDTRIGRCPYFIVVDDGTWMYEAVPNPCSMDVCVSGMDVARLLTERGATAVLTGDCSNDAVQAFGIAGLKVYRGALGTSVRAAVERFINKQY